ncbi:DsbA family protein [Azohydromonas caseinilytica]|uniref:Thioredoxin domain-containing protein n=1 Tax=Azohydromonas caseinilytica TaxID=2728836 RepID=A0A848FCL7_9BURK|nr:thioredoxin domain-containing protein [Azohydromonas caseinilytica]NML17068.1 thioredoxin domain-containing protein [Azohydromonas caseinilytica]
MNSKKLTVSLLLGAVLIAFLLGMSAYQKRAQESQQQTATEQANRLVRMHSPVLGPLNAPVTIVEFFDPACETCRAFYPIVKDLMAKYPNDVRVVVRYAPFHQGSDQVIALLEASRRQGKYEAVLQAVLAAQPMWADHAQPNVELAFRAAQEAGVDLQKARADAELPAVRSVLEQDVEDLNALGVNKTPTFFVNGRALPSFGAEQLAALVAEEVASARK